jgi:hypothetical protein
MRSYRIAVAATLLLLVLCAAVVAYWLWARQALGDGIARWRDQQIERGYTVDYAGPEFGGFPFALSVTFRQPRVTTPQGLTWQGPTILGEARLWDPFTIDLHFRGLHRLTADATGATGAGLPRAADIAAEDAGGRVVLQRDGRVESASVDLGGLVVNGPEIETVTLARLTARLGPLRSAASDPSGAKLEELDLVGEALAVKLPAGRGGLLGDQLDRLSFDSTIIGGIPPGRPAVALPAWRDRGGRWRFRHLAVLWGPLDLQADGALGLDAAMRPAGEFKTEIKGAGRIIDRLTQDGGMKPEAAFAARLALAAMGRTDAATGESVLAAPISLRQGMLYLGPIPLVPIAPVL